MSAATETPRMMGFVDARQGPKGLLLLDERRRTSIVKSTGVTSER